MQCPGRSEETLLKEFRRPDPGQLPQVYHARSDERGLALTGAEGQSRTADTLIFSHIPYVSTPPPPAPATPCRPDLRELTPDHIWPPLPAPATPCRPDLRELTPDHIRPPDV